MRELIDFIKNINSGTPQFRISESCDSSSPTYSYYNQSDLQDDLSGIITEGIERKTVSTEDEVCTLNPGDIIFSLISGTAAIVQREHQGYLYTQNYVRIVPDQHVDPKYLVYLFNEDDGIRRQWAAGLQGSMVTKYTIGQLKKLTIPPLPDLEKQRTIGEIYLLQLHLEALKKRAAERETLLRLSTLKEIHRNE